MMGIVIALLQLKGGAAKTTTAINLLGALTEVGYKAILVDMDTNKPDAVIWADNGDSLADKVIPLLSDGDPTEEIEKLKKEHDFILVDTPPNLEATAIKAALISDFCIIPCAAPFIERKALQKAATTALIAKKPYRFLATRLTQRAIGANRLITQLEETKSAFKTFTTRAVGMEEAQETGQWIGSFAPNSINHIKHKELAIELIETLKALGIKNE